MGRNSTADVQVGEHGGPDSEGAAIVDREGTSLSGSGESKSSEGRGKSRLHVWDRMELGEESPRTDLLIAALRGGLKNGVSRILVYDRSLEPDQVENAAGGAAEPCRD